MRDLLIKDLGWKLFSLFLAVTIWLTVHQINNESESPTASVMDSIENFKTLPVLIVSGISDVRAFRVSPSVVSVTVSGPSDVMATLQANQVRAMVDLTDLTNLTAAGNLKRLVDVSTPEHVTLVSIDPPSVGIILPPNH